MIYFVSEVDPQTGDIRPKRAEQPSCIGEGPGGEVIVPPPDCCDPTNADPALALFYEVPDQGDGK